MYTFTEPSEVKLIILYIIQNFGEAIDNGQITDIFMDYEFVDYFTMQKYLDELVEMRLVEVDRHSGLRLYFLTAHGQEAYDAYMKKIPVSVREKLLLSIRAYKKKERSEADISATYRPLNELSYAADLSIRESGFNSASITCFLSADIAVLDAMKSASSPGSSLERTSRTNSVGIFGTKQAYS